MSYPNNLKLLQQKLKCLPAFQLTILRIFQNKWAQQHDRKTLVDNLFKKVMQIYKKKNESCLENIQLETVKKI